MWKRSTLVYIPWLSLHLRLVFHPEISRGPGCHVFPHHVGDVTPGPWLPTFDWPLRCYHPTWVFHGFPLGRSHLETCLVILVIPGTFLPRVVLFMPPLLSWGAPCFFVTTILFLEGAGRSSLATWQHCKTGMLTNCELMSGWSQRYVKIWVFGF